MNGNHSPVSGETSNGTGSRPSRSILPLRAISDDDLIKNRSRISVVEEDEEGECQESQGLEHDPEEDEENSNERESGEENGYANGKLDKVVRSNFRDFENFRLLKRMSQNVSRACKSQLF